MGLFKPVPQSVTRLAYAGVKIAFQAGYLTLARRYPTVPIPRFVELCPPSDGTRDFLNSVCLRAVQSVASQSTLDAWARALLSLDVEVMKAAAAAVLVAMTARDSSFEITNKARLQIVLTSPFAGSDSESAALFTRLGYNDAVAVAALSESGGAWAGRGLEDGGGRRSADLVVSWKGGDGCYHMLVLVLKLELHWHQENTPKDEASMESRAQERGIEAVKQIANLEARGEYFQAGYAMLRKRHPNVVVEESNCHGVALVAGMSESLCMPCDQ
jgi:hypothetical protein